MAYSVIQLTPQAMLNNENNLRDERDSYSAQKQQQESNRPHGMEGEGMGGHNFGKDGKAPMGDDKDNPSRNAGYNNAYFARVAPTEEDTGNNNFKAAHQEGEPDYDAAHSAVNTPGPQEVPDQQKVGEDNGSQQETQQQSEGDEQQSNTGEQEHIET
jgi:hypothetical protein